MTRTDVVLSNFDMNTVLANMMMPMPGAGSYGKTPVSAKVPATNTPAPDRNNGVKDESVRTREGNSSKDKNSGVRKDTSGPERRKPAGKRTKSAKTGEKTVHKDTPASPAVVNGVEIEARIFSAILRASQESGNPLLGKLAKKPVNLSARAKAGLLNNKVVKDTSGKKPVVSLIPGNTKVASSTLPSTGKTGVKVNFASTGTGPEKDGGISKNQQAGTDKGNRTIKDILSALGLKPTEGKNVANSARQGATSPADNPIRQSFAVSPLNNLAARAADARRAGKNSVPAAKKGQVKAIAPAGLKQTQKNLNALFNGPDRYTQLNVQDSTGKGDTEQIVVERIGGFDAAPQFDTGGISRVSSGESLPTSATNQIADALRASAARRGGRIVIQLNPPELGKVRVMLNTTGRDVRGVLEVDNPDTLNQIRREAPALLSRLAEAGIQLRQIDVSLSDRGADDSSLYSQLNDENGAWQGAADDQAQQSPSDRPGPEEPAAVIGADVAWNEAGVFAEGTINVLI